MKIKFLQQRKVLHADLFVLLLIVAGLTKLQAQNITFADANVKAICVANWDTDSDGELSQAEAAAVTSLDGVFMFDDEISTFDELSFFTGLTALGVDEFNSCTSLTAISIPNAVASIGNYAFSDCISMASITTYVCAPPTLGSNVFDNVPSAVVVNVPCHTSAMYQAAERWSDFSNYVEFEYGLCPVSFVDDNVKAICLANWDTNGDGELSYAEAAAVTNLGTHFKSTNITSFDELEYFTSLTSLPNTAFYGCTSLASITLPSSVSALGNGSFYNCTSLDTMTVYAEIPPTVGTNAFKNVPTDMVVNVPCRACIAYRNASGWSEFANIQGFGSCIITFADSNVKALCVANWDTDGDGELSYAEAASVTSLGQVFRGNSLISSFDELQYFVGLTSIYFNTFTGCTGLTSIEFPNSLNYIGDYAFYNCSGLTSIEFPNSLIHVGPYSFYNCSGLTSIEIPNSVTSIDQYAFFGCSSLISIEIPNSVTSIGNAAFNRCFGLTSIEIPNSVTSIGTFVFANCSGLEQIIVDSGNTVYDSRESCNAIVKTSTNELVVGCRNTFIPISVTSIGSTAFSGCSGLTSIDIHSSVTSIGSSAFFGCSGLTSIEIPNSVTSIENNSFSGCSSLTSIELPNSLTSIGYYAFNNCSGLTSIILWADNPPALGNSVFYGVNNSIPVYVPCDSKEAYQNAAGWNNFNDIIGMCSGEVAVMVNPTEGGIVTGAGYYNGGDLCVLTATPNPGFSFVNWVEDGVVSTDSVYSFPAYATTIIANFCSNSPIVFADDTVKALCVANWDTDGDSELSYVEAAAVTSLGEVFRENTGIATFDELRYFVGLSSIGDNAFYYCTGLTSVGIPNSVSEIGAAAFEGCSNLSSIAVWAEHPPVLCIGCEIIEEEELKKGGFWGSVMPFDFVDRSIPVYVPCGSSEAYQNAEGWNEFTNFLGMCSGEVAVTVNSSEGGSVTGAGYYNGGELCVLTAIPNPGYGLGNWIENGVVVSRDTVYSFPAHPTTITANFCSFSPIVFADANVKALCVANWDTNGDGELSYVEAAAVTSLGSVFRNNSTILSFEELQYFIGLTSIGYEAFKNCTSLTSIIIPNSVTSIGYQAFYECNSLTSIEFPNSLVSIGEYVFYHCNGLTSIEIPNSVTSIGRNAFISCYGLRSMFVLANNPPALDSSAFSGVNKNTLVYVPCTTTETYQNAEIWDMFTNIIGLCSGEVAVTVNPSEGGTVTGAGYYEGGSLCVLTATPNPDFSFGNWTENGLVVSTDTAYSFHAHPTTIVANFCSHNPIVFADDNVKTLCVANWDADGDGELSYAEAANVMSLGEVFRNNSSISSFDELQYFIGLTSIGDYAFYYCTGLTSVEIPYSVTSIGKRAFMYCNGLSSVTIPNSVVSIDSYAFYHCTSLTSIEIPNSVNFLNNYVFKYCTGLTSVEIPNTITYFGYELFGYCTSLTSIEIPNSVTTFYDYAFRNSGLTSVEIPNSVTSLGANAFASCSGLAQIVVEAGNTVYDSRGNCNAVIKSSTNMLTIGCKNTVIPNSVTSIAYGAFYGSTDMASIEIPNSVTSIGTYAFYDCSGLTEVLLQGTTPPTLGNSTFFGSTCPIYVPYASLNTFKTANNWSNYASRIYPWLQKSISGYGTDDNNWAFIASPIVDSIAPTTVDNLITETAYDLYRFSPSDSLGEWQNYKAHTDDFKLVNGQGYLYANENEVNIIFKGEFNEDNTKELNLVYDANDERKCWNLVGNPFPCNATLNRAYYVLSVDGSGINPNPIETSIPPCTAVFVKALAEGETVLFTRVVQ